MRPSFCWGARLAAGYGLPGGALQRVYGGVIGGAFALMGIGGGAITNLLSDAAWL